MENTCLVNKCTNEILKQLIIAKFSFNTFSTNYTRIQSKWPFKFFELSWAENTKSRNCDRNRLSSVASGDGHFPLDIAPLRNDYPEILPLHFDGYKTFPPCHWTVRETGICPGGICTRGYVRGNKCKGEMSYTRCISLRKSLSFRWEKFSHCRSDESRSPASLPATLAAAAADVNNLLMRIVHAKY